MTEDEQRESVAVVEDETVARAAGDCATCGGDGKIRGGSVTCPDCGGSGKADGDAESSSALPLSDEVATHARSLAPRTTEWRRNKVPARGETERRNFALADLELRAGDDGDALMLVGYASVTGTGYSVGHYEETIARGAFKRTLGNPELDVQLLVNHAGLPLARTTSGTLRLSEDARGLRVEADLDPTDPDVQALAPKMRRGDVTEMSFAFRAIDQDWSDDYSERLIKSVDIQRGDVSIVAYGASRATSAALRSEALIAEIRSLGFDTFLGALVEWRDYTLLPIEDRAGKSLSSASMEVLTRVLNLVASADEAVDAAQPLLADLMGVPNPDSETPTETHAAEETPETRESAEEGESRGEASEAASEPEVTPETPPEPIVRRSPPVPDRTAQYRLWLDTERNRKAA